MSIFLYFAFTISAGTAGILMFGFVLPFILPFLIIAAAIWLQLSFIPVMLRGQATARQIRGWFFRLLISIMVVAITVDGSST